MEVRDLILEQNRRGKTIFFSSHILSDVESICHRVAIVNQGRVAAEGALSELLSPTVRLVDVELLGVEGGLPEEISKLSQDTRRDGEVVQVSVKGEDEADSVLRQALEAGFRVRSVIPRRETLEALFVRSALKS